MIERKEIVFESGASWVSPFTAVFFHVTVLWTVL